MAIVDIDGILICAPNIGVLMDRDCLGRDETEVVDAIRLAFELIKNPIWEAYCGGAIGPLCDYFDKDGEYRHLTEEVTGQKWPFCYSIPVGIFQEILWQAEESEKVTQEQKEARRKKAIKRRQKFDSKRNKLFIEMIKSGLVYECSHEACGAREDLTIDHINPIANGGSDDVENLQFLCRAHNSKKGAKVDV